MCFLSNCEFSLDTSFFKLLCTLTFLYCNFNPTTVATRQRLVRRTSYLRATATDDVNGGRPDKPADGDATSITSSNQNVDQAGK